MILRSLLALHLAVLCSAADRKLSALIVDGMNNHDWAAGTRAIQAILEGSGRFSVEVCTWPARPQFRGHDVVINNFNGGHLATGTRWPREIEQALETYVREGGGLVVFHAANNAFLEWAEYNAMIGLGWRDKTFGPGIAIGPGGALVAVPKGAGLNPGHGPRHDFEVFVREPDHPITRGLPAHWLHPSEQLTHGQHGPANPLTVLTYAFSEVSHQGEPMDWVRPYGRGRVYTTMLGHTWKDELSPNFDDVNFQALFARGAEWAATGAVTLAADLGWRPLFNGKDLEGWEPRGDCTWTVMPGGVLLGTRTPGPTPPGTAQEYRAWQGRQAWLYTKAEFGEFDLHVEYLVPPRGNSGVSIRDQSRAHSAIDEPDAARPDLGGYPKTTPAHIGYEIQILDYDATNSTGSIYTLVPARTGVHRTGLWNSMDIESRADRIRVRVNGQIVAEGPGDPARPKTGPIGLQLHDRFSTVMFRNLRIRPPASAQAIQIDKTGRVGRRIENQYFIADLSPRTINGREEDSGTLHSLTFKPFGVTLFRNPANGRMHKGQSLQRAGASGYKDQGSWNPVQTFHEQQYGGTYVHRREGYFSDYPEVRMEVEYRIPADAPYFIVSTVMSVEKPIRVVLLRNNEMTMNLFFTHLAWPAADGTRHTVAFDERKPLLEQFPIAADAPWMAFLNLEKGYGYGFVNLGYKATKSAHADITISDGTFGSAELAAQQVKAAAEGKPSPGRVINGRYWSRHIISGQEMDLVPGDRFEEFTAYVLFRCPKAEPLGEFFEWEKRIRALKPDAR